MSSSPTTDNNRVVEVVKPTAHHDHGHGSGARSTLRRGGGQAPGDVFIADTGNNRVVEVNADGTQSTVAAVVDGAFGVAVDTMGDLFIADFGNSVVEVTPPAARRAPSPRG